MIGQDRLKAEYERLIKKHFSFTKERELFIEVTTLAFNALAGDYQNVFIEVPTGVGKTGIVKTLAEALLSTGVIQNYLVMTPKIGLMEQYEQERGVTLNALKGRANFQCLGGEICDKCPQKHDPDRMCKYTSVCDAEHAPCRSKKFRCKVKAEAREEFAELKENDSGPILSSSCKYMEQYFNAVLSKRVLTNPAYFFKVQSGEHTMFETRSVAFYDEAHCLPNAIADIADKAITKQDWKESWDVKGDDENDLAPEFPLVEENEFWKKEIPRMVGVSNEKLKTIQDEISLEMKKDGKDEAILHELDKRERKFTELGEKLNFIFGMLDVTPVKVFVDYSKIKRTPSVHFKPIIIAPIAKFVLDKASAKRVFLSASFRDAVHWVNTLGLSMDKTLFIMVEQSPFDKKNRPLYYDSCGSMSFKQKEKNLPTLIKKVESILEKHKGQHGIILPYSYKLGDEIYNGMKSDEKKRIIVHTPNKDDRIDAIERFLNGTSDSVILSPYLNEGFDGRGDRARFLILAKMPYPSMKDTMIMERLKFDQKYYIENIACQPQLDADGLCQNFSCGQPCKRWYTLSTALTIIQMAGRIVRDEKDWGNIYILDGAFGRFYKKNTEFFPLYMREAITFL